MLLLDYNRLWKKFAIESAINDEQLDQFKLYYQEIIKWNSEICNLTTIIEPSSVIKDHFQDSLSLKKNIDLTLINSIADVGSGAGFPGIPLKIFYPHLKIFLIEVTHKKCEFLTHIIKELGLEQVEVLDIDWRTFLRKTDLDIDLFCSRAALHTEELLRMFKPSCFYNNRELVYWASRDWKASKKDEDYILKESEYILGNKKRRLIFFGLKNLRNIV